ncbi:hypothetical protein BGL34_04555 [Fructilactobacillus lindneri]|uniref:MmcQ/YjbR family DNA-binding protein n=2 Tax=Fructilactobacillus lindneri TaxID=53444 RepID=A0A0R2JM42_9LACO|nr:MmcQ/YjbR family DNA-binding protein [Fructilactobacillus lindneri]ANZ57584.1 hypothetical protein AYR60_01745 [Fructilactobacillus lindneri]ANZ58853.1 hypothetical protein AYR59_01745 [Fructilactobacillus lindneri]KRN78225.1 hypothetical protein IV52_GL001359 [Fructilactobacillus lindneri DSM 20690 = JCM 11027]POG97735.1 hypothetical protein BGL31_05890 [Fructilactobacillus lindneri]POH00040.1 hypothetical protein BGL32_04575 [Fructilactobacillus lindneri]
MITKKEVLDYVNDAYDTKPAYIFKKFPDYCVLKHTSNGKWYGIIMNVPEVKLGINGTAENYVIDLKVQKELVGLLQSKKGIFPAYHMNKEHWISVDLDIYENFKELKGLIDESYDLTS